MKLIELTQSRVAIVDNEDFDWLSKWKWYYARNRKSRKTGYVVRTDNNKHQQIRMHTVILKRYKCLECERQVDHINGCGCDNRKENLRSATPNTNGANKKRHSNNTSGNIGVRWHKLTGKWEARLFVNGKSNQLGLFVNKKDAIKVRRQAEIKYFGEYRYDPTNVCPLGPTGQCPDCAQRLRALTDETPKIF